MKEVRCAIYTRKSTEEGLDKEFNTLEAKREASENYVLSQKHQGWKIIPEHYDDGGFSGGNMNRPALERLLEDINVGKVNRQGLRVGAKFKYHFTQLPPNWQEVERYVAEKNIHINLEGIYSYYEANGWCERSGKKLDGWHFALCHTHKTGKYL